MGRITEEEAQKYTTPNGSWFQLKNDKDFATIQFVVSSPEDLAPYLCHRVRVGEKERYIDCLASYGKECPLCHAGHQQKLVRFIIMYQHEDNQMKIWERGSTFVKSLAGYLDRYQDLTTKVFQIERNGKAGDMKTQYQLYQMPDDTAVDIRDMETPKIMGGVILEKTAEELETYLQTGNFPNEEPATPAPQRNAYAQPPVQPRPQPMSRRDIPVSDRSVF